MSCSPSLESSTISFGSVFSQNSWRQLHRSSKGYYSSCTCTIALHSCLTCMTHSQWQLGNYVVFCWLAWHTVSGSLGTMSSSVAIAVKSSSEGFQPYSCGSTWFMLLLFPDAKYVLTLLNASSVEEMLLLWEVACLCWRLSVFHF